MLCYGSPCHHGRRSPCAGHIVFLARPRLLHEGPTVRYCGARYDTAWRGTKEEKR